MGYSKWFQERADNRRANVIARLYCHGHMPMATWLISAGMPRYDKTYNVFKWLSQNFTEKHGEVFFGACAIVSQYMQGKARLEIKSWADYRKL